MVLIYTTCPNRKTAKKLIETLLDLRLIACANFFKINSFYLWKNKIEKDFEYALILKTFKKNYKEIEKIILKNHPYNTPLVLMIDTLKVNNSYLKWLKKEIKNKKNVKK